MPSLGNHLNGTLGEANFIDQEFFFCNVAFCTTANSMEALSPYRGYHDADICMIIVTLESISQ